MKCQECFGKGKYDLWAGEQGIPCVTCKGTGEVPDPKGRKEK